MQNESTPTSRRWCNLHVLFPSLIAASLLGAPVSEGAVLTNGSLEVHIDPVIGAIDAYLFGPPDDPIFQFTGAKSDFFNPSHRGADFGFQLGTDQTTGVINLIHEPNKPFYSPLPVNVSADNVVTGIYNLGGAQVAFERSYSLVPGYDALQISTRFENLGGSVNLRYFDTYDPDQFSSFGTFNDVLQLGSATVAQARTTADFLGWPETLRYTAIVGSDDPRAVVGAGGQFLLKPNNDSGGFFIPGNINEFFSSPTDANDERADLGIHLGFDLFLDPLESTTVRSLVVGGTNPTAAQEAFLGALGAGNPNVVPEPSSFTIFSCFATLGLIAARKRKRAGRRNASKQAETCNDVRSQTASWRALR